MALVITVPGSVPPPPVDVARAIDYLGLREPNIDADLLAFFVQTANDWVADQVGDLTPTPVQLAVLELVRHFQDTWRGTVDGWDRSTGGGVADQTGMVLASVPQDVLLYLKPYMTKVQAMGSFDDPPCPSWPDPSQPYPGWPNSTYWPGWTG